MLTFEIHQILCSLLKCKFHLLCSESDNTPENITTLSYSRHIQLPPVGKPVLRVVPAEREKKNLNYKETCL